MFKNKLGSISDLQKDYVEATVLDIICFVSKPFSLHPLPGLSLDRHASNGGAPPCNFVFYTRATEASHMQCRIPTLNGLARAYTHRFIDDVRVDPNAC